MAKASMVGLIYCYFVDGIRYQTRVLSTSSSHIVTKAIYFAGGFGVHELLNKTVHKKVACAPRSERFRRYGIAVHSLGTWHGVSLLLGKAGLGCCVFNKSFANKKDCQRFSV